MLAQEVTVSFTVDIRAVVTWMVIGLIVGTITGLLFRGRRFGLLGWLVTGLLGALVGGFLFAVLQLDRNVAPALLDGITIRWIDIIVAFIGALIVIALIGLLYGFRRRL